MPTLQERVLKIIADDFNVARETIKFDSKFTTDLGFDSLDHVEFIHMIEDEFSVEVPIGESAQLDTPAAVVAWLVAANVPFEGSAA